MTVNILNICQGPADLYVGVYGTAEPADSAATVAAGPPGVGWVNVGGTEGGVSFVQEDTYVDRMVTQIPLAIGGRRVNQSVYVTTQLKEATLANLSTALNSLTTTTVAGSYSSIDPSNVTTPTQPVYAALIFDAWAPALATGPARRRVIVRKALAKPRVSVDAEMEKSQLYGVTWQVYFVSATTPPWHWVDQTA